MPEPRLTLRQLNRATLARQLLLARARTPLVRAVEQLVGMQAQLPRPPFIGLWSRVQAFRHDDLVDQLTSRRVVRATTLRGTIHLMSASDFLAIRPALQPALDRGLRVLGNRADGLDLETITGLAHAFFKKPQTFDAFRGHLQSKFPKTDIRAMAYAARLRLPLVQVPTGTRWGFPGQADFVRADVWTGRKPGKGCSVEALVLRYLAGYGPARVADVQAWSGLQGLAPVVKGLRDTLLVFRDEAGAELFDLPDAPRPDPDLVTPVRFVPEYDNVIVSRADARVLPAKYKSKVFLSALRVLPTFLVDGFAAGTWKVERKKATATLCLAPFAAVPARTRAEVEAEGQALLKFVEPDAGVNEIRW